MLEGPASAIRAVESIAARNELRDYPLLYATLPPTVVKAGDAALNKVQVR